MWKRYFPSSSISLYFIIEVNLRSAYRKANHPISLFRTHYGWQKNL